MSLVAGLDVSLCSTGICIIDGTQLVSQELVKSKPLGDSYHDETLRLIDIMTRITSLGTEFAKRLKDIDLVVVEGLAFAVRHTTSVMQLAALHYGIRMALEMEGKKIIIAVPSQVKKFGTGKGTAKKEEMMLEVYKRYGFSFSSNDLADAFILSMIGRNLMEESKDLTKPQKEVLKALQPQME